MKEITKEHYVTLFDSNFLPQGLSLYHSLQQQEEEFCLWVVCMDEECKDTLLELNYPNITTISLAAVETPELISLKLERSRAEYCWTVTPFAPRWVFEADPLVTRVTYVDADMFFFESPRPLLKKFEKSGKAVMITDHHYAPEYDQSATSGRFCVQFMPFLRDESEIVRQWWEDRCVEWCYQRMEDGKFGDQKYIESFPVLFPDEIHICQQERALLAPWNVSFYAYSKCIGYHFHGFRLLENGTVCLYPPGYLIPRPTRMMLYEQYLAVFIESMTVLGMCVKPDMGSVSFLNRVKSYCNSCIYSYINRMIEKADKFRKKQDAIVKIRVNDG